MQDQRTQLKQQSYPFVNSIINNNNRNHHNMHHSSRASSATITPIHSLDANSTFADTTRSIQMPYNNINNSLLSSSPRTFSSSSTQAKELTLSNDWSSPSKSNLLPPSIVPFQSNLGASLAAHKQLSTPPKVETTEHHQFTAGGLNLSTDSLQRQYSVPSSCGSTVSPLSSSPTSPLSHHSPTSSVHDHTHHRASSPFDVEAPHTLLRRASSVPTIAPDPISLWFGCEETDHARAVLIAYATALSVISCATQRPPNSRAPLEFIGRVKREKLDVAKLHRLIDQHRHAPPRSRYPSAIDAVRRTQRLGMQSSSPSSSTRFDFSPSSSPSSKSFMPSSSTFNTSSDPLRTLPQQGSFATLDLVSIYSRDTLPLGLVFPLIRHEWLATVWNINDGVPEQFIRVKTEYEQLEEEEEEEEDEDDEGRIALDIYSRAIGKPMKINSQKSSPNSSPAPSLGAPALLHSNSSTTKACRWHTTSTSAAVAPAPSTTSSTSSSSSDLSTASASSSPEPVCTTSYLYNLPVFSAECESSGSFNSFGCKIVRPLGDKLGRNTVKKSTSSSQQQENGLKQKPHKKKNQLQIDPPPSSLGYSGAQNDCVYNCLQALGRKVKVNGATDSETCEKVCTGADAEADMQKLVDDAAAAAAQAGAEETKEDDDADHDEEEDQEESAVDDDASSSSDDDDSSSSEDDDDDDNDEDEDEDEAVNDDLNDIASDDGGFSFESADDDDDTAAPLPHVRQSSAVPIKKSPQKSPQRIIADCDSQSNSFSNSLGNDLAEQLRALGLKK